MRKLLLVSIRRLPENFRHEAVDINSNIFFLEAIERTHDMLSGNIFLGPTYRGPFSAEFQRSGVELLDSFESGIEPIIGHQRYGMLSLLFNSLRLYVQHASNLRPFDRLTMGLTNFFLLNFALHQSDVIPFERTQWELRQPTEQELANVRSVQLRNEWRNQSFWDVKRSTNRKRRSVVDSETPTVVKKSIAIMDHAKDQWSKFTLDLMMILMEASNRNKELDWTCHFACLFKNYTFDKREMMNDRQQSEPCITFDEFLYSKIYTIPRRLAQLQQFRETESDEEMVLGLVECYGRIRQQNVLIRGNIEISKG